MRAPHQARCIPQPGLAGNALRLVRRQCPPGSGWFPAHFRHTEESWRRHTAGICFLCRKLEDSGTQGRRVATARLMDRCLPGSHLAAAETDSSATCHSSGAGARTGGVASAATSAILRQRGFQYPTMMRRWTHRRPHRPAASTRTASGTAALSGNHLAMEQHARQARQHLQELGPAHSCLALYLASRLDALPAEYCREFALAPDSSQVLPPAQVHEILGQELGAQFDRVFAEFDFLPFQSTLIAQSHYGRLRTGAEVVVILLHPFWYGLQNKIVPEFLNVTEIEALFGGLLPFDVLTDFSTALGRKADLALTREALELLARDSASFEFLFSPRTFAELSTAKLLTIERLQAPSLLFQHQDNGARRLCHVWLQQAVHGRCFPVDLQMHNIYVLEDNRISFLGCEFVGLPSSTRENLSKYLGALMANDPDTAAMYLLREMAPRHAHHKIDTELFRTNFRQAAYFGMLEPILGTDSNALAQLVFQHWKTALDHGYVPQPHLLCFYRGLFSVAKIAKQLSPNKI